MAKAGASAFGELILADHAQGALEIFGDVFPFGAGCDAALGVAQGLVIFPSANVAYIFHSGILTFKFLLFFLGWPYYSIGGFFLL